MRACTSSLDFPPTCGNAGPQGPKKKEEEEYFAVASLELGVKEAGFRNQTK
jgi:hypothetical protein